MPGPPLMASVGVLCCQTANDPPPAPLHFLRAATLEVAQESPNSLVTITFPVASLH